MNKLQGKLVAGLGVVAFFGLLGSAHAQAPAPMDTAAPPMMSAAAPAPMASDNMAGQLGIGVGVQSGSSFINTNDAQINMKYWLSDVLAVMPQLALGLKTAQAGDAQWQFAPAALMLYCPWKTTSTRLSVGGGLGLSFSKMGATTPTDTTITIRLPIYAGVEHFFTKWFSMGIAVQDDFLYYTKTGPTHSFNVTIDNTSTSADAAPRAVGFLFFYTD